MKKGRMGVPGKWRNIEKKELYLKIFTRTERHFSPSHLLPFLFSLFVFQVWSKKNNLVLLLILCVALFLFAHKYLISQRKRKVK